MKESLPTHGKGTARRPTSSRCRWILVVFVVVCIVAQALSIVHPVQQLYQLFAANPTTSFAPVCPQVAPLVPKANADFLGKMEDLYDSKQFLAAAIEWLGGAVRVPTETFDDMGPVGEDKRWENRAAFYDYLLGAFPLVHTTLELTKVNTYGLVYVWKGSDESLKPILLMGHQDVVPVVEETKDKWAYPPYSGHFDGERIWGRGSSDDKSGLIGIMVAVESMIKQGFKPTRSVVLSFGFDEEAGGPQGAGRLAPYLLERYGEDAFELIVDEGAGFGEEYGTVFATVGIAEKGSMNMEIEVTAPGGHSSVPPAHTSIGILSALLVHIEDHPFKTRLHRSTPVYSMIQCLGEHAAGLPKDVRKAIRKSASSDHALRHVEKIVLSDKSTRALIGTTQAIDLISGGVKSNALPERASALVNHRIATDSSVGETMSHDAHLLKHLAHKFNLTYTAFGKALSPVDATAAGTLTLSAPHSLEPAPITPTDAKAYLLLSGTIKAAYAAHRPELREGQGVLVRPGIMSGNTDTKYYWKLSQHIFRYNHHNQGSSGLGNIHTVNESIVADAFLEMIRFFTILVLNADEVVF